MKSFDESVEWRVDGYTGEFEMVVPGGSVYACAIDTERLYTLLQHCERAIKREAAALKHRSGLDGLVAVPVAYETRGALPLGEKTDHDHAPTAHYTVSSRL